MAEEDTVSIEKSTTTALKLNNNLLGQWDDFSSTMHQLFVDPALTLAWIDLSFNELRTIDEVSHCLPSTCDSMIKKVIDVITGFSNQCT